MNRIGDNLIHFGANENIVRSLRDAGAKFVVVGGLAVAWHCRERQADDMDLLVDPTTENSVRIHKALACLGLTGFGPESFARLGLQVSLKQNYHADLLTPEAGGLSYLEIESAAVDAMLFGFPVRVASVSTLLQMKSRAAMDESHRQKHETDIALLKHQNAA